MAQSIVICHPVSEKIGREIREITVINFSKVMKTYILQTENILFFSLVHGTSSRIEHVIGHKTSLSKFLKIKIISCIFSDHQGVKLETKKSKHQKRISNTWRLNYMLLNEQWVRGNQRGN